MGHLTKDYINDFMNFIVQINNQFSEAERMELKSLIKDLRVGRFASERKDRFEAIDELDAFEKMMLIDFYKTR